MNCGRLKIQVNKIQIMRDGNAIDTVVNPERKKLRLRRGKETDKKQTEIEVRPFDKS